jgi:ABC-type sugar transport system ATPase subunit
VQPNDFCSKYSANDLLIDAEIERRAREAQKALEIEKALKRVP